MTKPISPDEAVGLKKESIPSEVIEIFNELIVACFDGKEAVVYQDSAMDEICERLEVGREEVYERHLLDVEPLFRENGWEVEYDKPGYGEDYACRFIFTRK